MYIHIIIHITITINKQLTIYIYIYIYIGKGGPPIVEGPPSKRALPLLSAGPSVFVQKGSHLTKTTAAFPIMEAVAIGAEGRLYLLLDGERSLLKIEAPPLE